VKGLVQVTKTVTKHFVGVPSPITSVQGRIESISCGDHNTYAVVKI